MIPKTRRRKAVDARSYDAEHKARMKRIDAILKRMDEREKKRAPMIRELRKFVNE